MSAEKTCLFCGGEITPQNILFTYKSYVGPSYEDERRTSFLSSCSTGMEARVGENSGGTTRYKALYFEPNPIYDMEFAVSGLPINMFGVPVNAGLTPRQLARKQRGEDTDTGEAQVTDTSKKTLTTRVCPHCHCELPRNFGLYPIISVAMVGGKSAGKTAFLLALTQRLESDLSNRNLGTASLVGESQEYYDMLMESYLELEGRTTGTPTGSRLFPFVFEYTSLNESENSCYVSIYDMAGENMKDADALGEQMGLKRSNTILMMLDSNQLNRGMYFSEEMERTNQSDDDLLQDSSSARQDSINSYNDPIDKFLAARIASYRGSHLFDHVSNVVAVLTKCDQVLCSKADSSLFRNDNMCIKQNLEREVQGPGGRMVTEYVHMNALDSMVLAKLEQEMDMFYQHKKQQDIRKKITNAFRQTGKPDEPDVNVALMAVSTWTRHPELEQSSDTCVFKNDYTEMGAKHRIVEPFLLILAGNGRIPVKGQYAQRYSPRPQPVKTVENDNFNDIEKKVDAKKADKKPEKKPEKKKRRGLFGWGKGD